MIETAVAGVAQSLKYSTLEVVEYQAQGLCTGFSEGSESKKISGGIAPSWCRQGKAPEVVCGWLENEFQVKGLEG